MHDYENHRQRVKARFKSQGLDGFQEYEVLELLLFYCIPRKDTKAIAHALINRFGSLEQVIAAPEKELNKIEGVGENAALFIKLLRDLDRYLDVSKRERLKKDTILKDVSSFGAFIVPYFKNAHVEKIYLLCLDAKCKVLSCREVCEGNVNSVAIPLRKIVDVALTENASFAVLAHNHPSGVAVPSQEDIQTTLKVANLLHQIEVVLADHIVVGDVGDYVSMVESGMYKPGLIYQAL